MGLLRLLCNYLLRISNALFTFDWHIQIFKKHKNIAGHKQPGIQINILFLKKKVAGWAWLTTGRYYSAERSPYGVIYSLAVATVFRRLGIGKLIIEQCIKQGKEKGLKELVVIVLKSNTAAIKFYHKLGFVDANQGLYKDKYMLEKKLYPNKNTIALVISIE